MQAVAQKELEAETGDAPGPRCSSFSAHPIWCVLEGWTARPAPGDAPLGAYRQAAQA